MRTQVAHALRFANSGWTRRSGFPENPQFIHLSRPKFCPNNRGHLSPHCQYHLAPYADRLCTLRVVEEKPADGTFMAQPEK